MAMKLFTMQVQAWLCSAHSICHNLHTPLAMQAVRLKNTIHTSRSGDKLGPDVFPSCMEVSGRLRPGEPCLEKARKGYVFP
mmetsp:Transcript_117957/g.280003  ORF Transcript_117957/g.280003 Transcript_117957/m.280003 type:complete len:81 (+) Transcript_117957:149-391(+)